MMRAVVVVAEPDEADRIERRLRLELQQVDARAAALREELNRRVLARSS